MDSWLMIIILTILLLISIGTLLLFYWDIKKMTAQLEEIIENFGTNELVRTNTHSKTLNYFISNINRLIHLFKQDQQFNQKREIELRHEITNISHDLRTPLTSLKGFSDLLTDPTLLDTEKEEFLAIIQKKIDHLTMMVDLFYELSQINSSAEQLTMKKQFLDEMIVETMLLFYEDFEESQLSVHIDEKAVSPIFADEKATNRIITNIIQNALRYTKSYFTIYLVEEKDHVRLRAVNDVDEVDYHEIHRLFDRFYKLDTSRASGQLGLGLHIVQQLINNQGGLVVADVHQNTFSLDVLFKKWD